MITSALFLKRYNELLRFDHSLFGLPFLLTGALLPWLLGNSFEPLRFSLVLIGFLLARFSGMAFNQLIDCDIDAKNPRTQNRPLPTHRISKKAAAAIAWGALITFLVASFFLGFTLFVLTLLAASLIFTYSYFKRFSASSHFILGSIHALAPLMAFLLMGGTMGVAPLLLSLTALLTISGSDILYAIQDIAFDRRERLFSLPAFLGEKSSYRVGRVLHFSALLSLTFFGFALHATSFFFLAPFTGFLFLIWHHRAKKSLLLFNGMMSLLTLLFTLGDHLWAVML